jgi:predicted N-acetyltransferase YhbS
LEHFQDIDLFKKYEVDRMFVLHMIAVDTDFAGRGIGGQLVRHGIDQVTQQSTYVGSTL